MWLKRYKAQHVTYKNNRNIYKYKSFMISKQHLNNNKFTVFSNMGKIQQISIVLIPWN